MEESHYAEYIGKLFKGSISIIPSPQDEEFSDYAREVYRLSPSENVIKSEQLVVPALHIGAPSDSIKYVFYIIKENRTYDQVYGDIPEGNGDSSLCIFPETVTPNQHKLVKEYTLFDNFYCDAEVSADGHNWSTAAYATDYVEKNWPVLYGRNGGEYDFEGGVPIASPSSGYIWDAVLRAGLTYRNYGEFVERVKVDSTFRYVARDNYMRPYNCEDYPGFDLNISDLRRVEKWAAEFDEFERSGNLPNLSLLRLPNDHTVGTRKGSLTPTAFVAQNDYALGLIVERISQSKFWKQSIIFVVEDDAQNGADHVDAHRSCLLVISPYVKSHYVDHTLYSSSSVLKTIELILGLNPMTQFDLFANPIVMCFQNQANVNSFKAEIPRVDIEAKNITDNYDSKKCEEFDLTREDAIPDIEFNEIIWRSVKGEDSQMPAPVRSAFVTIINEDDD
jgi:hypothetical protein